MTNNNLDFSRIKRDEVRPRPSAEEIDQVGDAAGFTSREAPVKRYRRRRVDEPQTSLSMRLAIRDHNAFVKFCDDEHMPSYAAGLVELMRRAGVKEG